MNNYLLNFKRRKKNLRQNEGRKDSLKDLYVEGMSVHVKCMKDEHRPIMRPF